MTDLSPPSPLGILLAAMHARWQQGDEAGAVALARIAAPYLHPRRGQVPHRPDSALDPERLTDAELERLLYQPGSGTSIAEPPESVTG